MIKVNLVLDQSILNVNAMQSSSLLNCIPFLSHPTIPHCARTPLGYVFERLSPLERIKPLVCVPDEWQIHLGRQIISLGGRLCAQCRRRIRLRNLVDGEILRIDVGLELGLKWSSDAAQSIPLHTAEESVLLDLVSATDAAKAILRFADEADQESVPSVLCGDTRTSCVVLTVEQNPQCPA